MGWGKINKLKITKSRKNFQFMNFLKCGYVGRMSFQIRTNCNGFTF